MRGLTVIRIIYVRTSVPTSEIKSSFIQQYYTYTLIHKGRIINHHISILAIFCPVSIDDVLTILKIICTIYIS